MNRKNIDEYIITQYYIINIIKFQENQNKILENIKKTYVPIDNNFCK